MNLPLVALSLLLALQSASAPWRPAFVLVHPELFAAPGGQANAWADIDADGDLDYFVGFRGRPNRLYRNDGGRFADVAAQVGLADAVETRAAAWGDYDLDGDPDLYVGFADATVPGRLYRNDARGRRFVDVAAAMGIALRGVSRQPAWIDYDGDGDLDLFAAFRDEANRLLRNDGGRFTDVTAEAGIGDTRASVSGVWWDYERDGDLDLFIANQGAVANGLWRQHRGRFEDVAAAAGVAGTPRPADEGGVGPSLADVDRDGDFDLFVANYGRSALYRSDPDGGFTDIASASGVGLSGHAVTSAAGDLDNDGFPELFVANFIAGQPRYRDALFQHRGAGSAEPSYTEVLPEIMTVHDATHGAQFVDFDRDGRLDLALTNNDPDGGGHPLLRNVSSPAGRSLMVEVSDHRGRLSRAGSEVRIFQTSTRRLLATALVDSGGGYCSQNAMPVHLGIAADWPGRIDVEVTIVGGGERRITARRNIDPDNYRGRPLRIQTFMSSTLHP